MDWICLLGGPIEVTFCSPFRLTFDSPCPNLCASESRFPGSQWN